MKTQFLGGFLKNNPVTLLGDFQRDPFAFFESHRPADSAQPVKLRLGHRLFFLSYDPQHAQRILHEAKEKYDKSSLVLAKIKSLSGPEGLIQLQGDDALKVRQCAGQLMTPAAMDRLVGKISKFVDELADVIDRSIEKKEALDLAPHLTRIVLRTAGVFILNHDLISESDELNKAFVLLNRKAGESLRSLFSFGDSKEKKEALKCIHRELGLMISKAAEDNEPSLLKALLTLQKSDSFVQDQIKAFLFAGYDTTASSLIYASYLTAAHPQVQEKIALEAQGDITRYEQVRGSVYIQAVYQESLRLYPSAYFLPRETNQIDQLGGIKIPKGAQVFLSVKHIQRHAEYFDNPDEFCPERFLNELKHPYSFLPFGGGPRICIGAMLAKLEATLVLQKLCARYEMKAARAEAPAIEALITAHTKEPLPIYFKKREFVKAMAS